MEGIKAVLFDMDGLLLDTERVSGQAWQLAAEEKGYVLPWEVIYSFVGKKYEDVLGLLARALNLSSDEANALGARKHEIKDELGSQQGVSIMPGALELLEAFQKRDIHMAVVTSTDKERAEAILSRVGIRHYFCRLICGDEVERGKPYPDIYLEAISRLGVEAEACIAFEDSSAGTLAASGAGVKTYAVPDLLPLSPEAGDAAYQVLKSLKEFHII